MSKRVTSAEGDRLSTAPVDCNGWLQLSPAQKRIWREAQVEEGDEAHRIPFGLYLKGDLDYLALTAALERIVVRHDILRSVFGVLHGEPVQRIAPKQGSEFHIIRDDLRNRKDADAEFVRLTEREGNAPFSLEEGPAVRGRLVRLAEDEHALLITVHQIVFDCWSMGIFKKELSVLYAAFRDRSADPLPKLKFQYSDYVVWQSQWTKSEILKQQVAYWQSALTGTRGDSDVPTEQPAELEQKRKRATAPLKINGLITAQLKRVSRRHGVTLFMTLLGAWVRLLSKLSGNLDVVTGIQVANRGRAEFHNVIGLFENILALRIKLSDGPSLAELLQRVKGQTIAALQHQDVALEQLIEVVQPTLGISRIPNLHNVFAWQSVPAGVLECHGLELRPVPITSRSLGNFHLMLKLWESADGIEGGIDYSTALFKKETVESYLSYLQDILKDMVSDEYGRVGHPRVQACPEKQDDRSVQDEDELDNVRHWVRSDCAGDLALACGLNRDAQRTRRAENEDTDHVEKEAPRDSAEKQLLGIWADTLNIGGLGVKDNFFEVGGNSLHLMHIGAEIRRVLGEEVSLKDLFQHDTVESLARFIRDRTSNTMRRGKQDSARGETKALSFGELSIWLLLQLSPVRRTVNESIGLALKGHLDVQALEKSVADLIRRHDSLRTSYHIGHPQKSLFALVRLLVGRGLHPARNTSTTHCERPAPRVADKLRPPANLFIEKLGDLFLRSLWSILVRPYRVTAPFDGKVQIPIVELSHLSGEQREAELARICKIEGQQLTDLSSAPLLRVTLFRFDEDEHRLLVVISRAIADGSSLSIMRDELGKCYDANCLGRTPHLPEVSRQYADYLACKGSEAQQRVFRKSVIYWRNRLKAIPPRLRIPFDGEKQSALITKSAHFPVELSEKTSEAIRKYSHRKSVTVFMALLAAYKVLLHILTEEQDIAVGALFDDRPRYGMQGAIGHFTTGVLFRTCLSGNPSFSEILARLRCTIMDDYEHADSAAIMMGIGPTNLLRRGGEIVNTYFNWAIEESSEAINMRGLNVTSLDVPVQEMEAMGDLDVVGSDRDPKINLQLVYKAALFSPDRIRDIAERFQCILVKCITDDNAPLREYRAMLSPKYNADLVPRD